MRKRKLASMLLAFSLLSLSASPTFAQKQQGDSKPETKVSTTQGEGGSIQTTVSGKRYADAMAVYVSSFGYKEAVIKGQPLSAQAINETIQTLADGNRIIRKSTTTIYRDSDGRTRREQILSKVGPYSVAGDAPQIIYINDPVAGVSYTLDPRTHIARKSVAKRIAYTNGYGKKINEAGQVSTTVAATPDAAQKAKLERAKIVKEKAMAEAKIAKGESKGKGISYAGSSTVVSGSIAQTSSYSGTFPKRETKEESLGKQMMEGVEVEGTRYTYTIPAGEIGNELPINVVSEKWYSQELQQTIYSKTTDPRFGETIYRLTNINRSEPDRSLFEVPADYTIKEGKEATTIMEKKIKEATQQKKPQ